MQRIVVLGGGFAGLWSALGAARKLDEHGVGPSDVRVTLIDQNAFHSIRVRNYEQDLEASIIPFAEVLDPVGVEHIAGTVCAVDTDHRIVQVRGTPDTQEIAYDRLVYALGSQLWRPPIAGLAEHAFDIDTYRGAKRLQAHLNALPGSARGPEKFSALVVGAGLTGIEMATELPERLARLAAASGSTAPVRVTLLDSSPVIGSDMGAPARAVIAQALAALGVATSAGAVVTAVDATGVTLANGEKIGAATVIWCAGMRANSLGASLPVEKDRMGRLAVDEFMRVKELPHVFAAGDAAWSLLDGQHASVMSCQHGRPMGRYAGHNVAADLLGKPMLPLRIDWYTTVLDLGPWGAVYTLGWERAVTATGKVAKQTKCTINRERIYPPRTGKREDLLAAAAAYIQAPPAVAPR